MTWLDKTIEYISPKWAAEREAWREYKKFSARGYRSATTSRLGADQSVSASPDFHLEQAYDRRKMTDRSRQLVRNNSIARGLLSVTLTTLWTGALNPRQRPKALDGTSKRRPYLTIGQRTTPMPVGWIRFGGFNG